MANNTYIVQYATTGRAACKAKDCRKIIEKDSLRIGKKFPSARFTEDGEATDWFHPKCMFEVLSRARKTTKRIESTADLQGFGSLEAADQKFIKDYIDGKIAIPPPIRKKKDSGDAPSSPKPKKAKATKPTSSKKKTQGKVLKVWAIRNADNKRVDLPVGGTFFGRGNETGITDKKCSRSQLEVSVSPGNVSIRANGANPSILIRVDGIKEVMDKGVEYDLNDGDSFCVLLDEYQYTVHVQRESDSPSKPPAAASKTKRPKDESDEEEILPPPKLSKLSDSESDDVPASSKGSLPKCKFGPACYRTNPAHFKEFAHPWKDDE